LTISFQFGWEVLLIQYLQGIIGNSPLLVSIISMFSSLASAEMSVFIICFFYWSYNRKIGLHLAMSLLFSSCTNSLIKNLFLRNRPYFVNEEIECLRPVEPEFDINDMAKQGYSFPSGHANNIASLIYTLYSEFKNKHVLYIGNIIIFLVALSRVVLGVHYPSDVLVGIFIGFISILFIQYMLKHFDKKITYIFLVIFCGLGVFYCDSNDYFSTYGLLCGFVLADLFNDKYNDFSNTDNILRGLIRLVCGFALFLIVNTVLKKIFNTDSYYIRSLRYAINSFIIIGIYPLLFKYNIFKFK